MNSIGKDCNDLKKAYEDCFNSWFSEKFLHGSSDDTCAPLFSQYQTCVKKAIADKNIGKSAARHSMPNWIRGVQTCGKWNGTFWARSRRRSRKQEKGRSETADGSACPVVVSRGGRWIGGRGREMAE